MKKIKYIILLAMASAVMMSCKKTDADTIDINFTASNTNPSVGDTVTFQMSYGADALSIYTGDNNHEFANSALLNLKKDDNTTQYIKTDERYGVYNLDAKSLTDNPASIMASGTATLAPKTDSLILVNTTGLGDNNELIIKPNIALYPDKVDPVITGNLDRNLNMGIQLRGGSVDEQVLLRITIKIAGVYTDANNSKGRQDVLLSIPETVDTVLNISPDLGALADQWRSDNSSLDYGPIEEVKIQIGVGDGKRFSGQFGVRDIHLGSPIYIPWDTGQNVKYLVPNQPTTFKYIYSQPGTYIATMIATKVGAKKFGPDGYIYDRADQIGEDEYDIDRQYKQIKIVVK